MYNAFCVLWDAQVKSKECAKPPDKKKDCFADCQNLGIKIAYFMRVNGEKTAERNVSELAEIR